MSVQSWRCPNCSANMILRAEEGLFRCPYCDTSMTIGDVTELVRHARRKAEEAAARQDQSQSDVQETRQQPAPSRGGKHFVSDLFKALGGLLWWAASIACGLILLLLGLALLTNLGSFSFGLIVMTLLFMVPPALILRRLMRGKKIRIETEKKRKK